jgi:type IV secretory pathway TraG/TraD family ATPase VirD4
MTMPLATAQWADPAFVEEKYLYRDGSVWLGRSASHNEFPLGYTDDRHVCLVSGTRGGKGTSSILNNLCLWPGSLVVIDPKGENATVTAPRRGTGSDLCEGLRQAVHVLDPFRTAQVQEVYWSRFNPLDTLSVDGKESIDGAALIADALVIIHEEAKDPFWDESARALVKGLLLHVLTAPEYEGRRNLITLRKLISRGDWEAVEALRQSGERDIASGQQLLWAGVKRNPAFDGLVAGIGDKFSSLLDEDPKIFHGVLQVADLNTEFIDSPGMQECLEASDFQLSELKTWQGGLSLYLCLPQRCMSTHYRWLRMMISLIVMEMEVVKGQPVTGYPLLMLLDEFAGLERMKVIENAVAQMAGFGVKMFFVLQSLTQLKKLYKDNWETFLANSGLKLFFGLDEQFSRDYVSKLIGDTEIIREVRSEGDSSSESENASESRSQSRSESMGDSTSRGHSVSEGTNRSVSQSESHGTSQSSGSGHSISSSCSWLPTSFLKLAGSSSVSQTSSKSTSEGRSESRSRSESRGTSHGTSDSMTTGRSHTSGTSDSETSGTTHGTSRGRTSGTSETVHRRPLISPDEIGHVFARIDDRDRAAYPGLGLALIAGQAPVAFRRVNYYEDAQFIGYFQPHPGYEFSPPRKDRISEKGLEPYKSHFQGLLRWRPAASRGAAVQAGDIIGYAQEGTFLLDRSPIRAPRTGRLTSTPARDLKWSRRLRQLFGAVLEIQNLRVRQIGEFREGQKIVPAVVRCRFPVAFRVAVAAVEADVIEHPSFALVLEDAGRLKADADFGDRGVFLRGFVLV